MKKLNLFLICLMASFGAFAQHNYDNQNVIYSSGTNRVNIGTSTLHGNYGTQSPVLQVVGETGGWLTIGKITADGNNDHRFSLAGTQFGNALYYNDNSSFSFQAGGTIMRLLGNQDGGFVGIGTDTPLANWIFHIPAHWEENSTSIMLT